MCNSTTSVCSQLHLLIKYSLSKCVCVSQRGSLWRMRMFCSISLLEPRQLSTSETWEPRSAGSQWVQHEADWRREHIVLWQSGPTVLTRPHTYIHKTACRIKQSYIEISRWVKREVSVCLCVCVCQEFPRNPEVNLLQCRRLLKLFWFCWELKEGQVG